MRLEDINETVFQSLTPEVQSQIIDASSTDPVAVVLVVAMMLLPIVLMR